MDDRSGSSGETASVTACALLGCVSKEFLACGGPSSACSALTCPASALPAVLAGDFWCSPQLNTLYMFWIHTDLVGRLPWPLEDMLNTPSHHRLHHRPPGNCNYAGVLIVWDKLFGTFVAETSRRAVYGLAKQPNTFDPLALNTNHLHRMVGIHLCFAYFESTAINQFHA